MAEKICDKCGIVLNEKNDRSMQDENLCEICYESVERCAGCGDELDDDTEEGESGYCMSCI